MGTQELKNSVMAWRNKLASWQVDGLLQEALTSSFKLTNREQQEAESLIGAQARPIEVSIGILDNESLGGLLGAYAPSTTTIYLNEKLAHSQELTELVLSHEVGHYLADRLELGQPDHPYISSFVETLLPGARQRPSTASSGLATEKTPNSIKLPNGERHFVSAFNTTIHNDFTAEALPILSKGAETLIGTCQSVVDDWTGTDLSLQYYSFQHFDNNNISGSTAAIRRWYEDGINNFNGKEFQRRNDKISGLVNPYFSTKSAGRALPAVGISDPFLVGNTFASEPGIFLLLWRFGQVAHALQDFYAHSNWVELVEGDKIPRKSIFLTGHNLPEVVKAGSTQTWGNLQIVVAEKGGDYSSFIDQALGIDAKKNKVQLKFKLKDVSNMNVLGPVFTAWGSARPDYRTYGALMTGAVSRQLYKDPILSVPLVGNSGWYEGLDHGGLAGIEEEVRIKGSGFLPAINKDSEKNALHRHAQAYAALQLQNEWDRLGNLINKTYGVGGLKRFAALAVAEQYRNQYVDTYSRGSTWNWQTIKGFSLGTETSFANTSSSALESEAQTADVAQELSQSLPAIRLIEVFSNAGAGSEANYRKLQFQNASGRWLDSALESFDIHHDDLSEEEISLLKQPRAIQHADAGERAYWMAASSDSRDTNGTAFYIESTNKDVKLTIDNFDIFSDEIIIVGADGSESSLPSSYYSYDGFKDLQAFLKTNHNVEISANPMRDGATNTWFLSKDDLTRISKPNRRDHALSSLLTLRASQLFDDPNVIGEGLTKSKQSGEAALESKLYFSDYDDSLPFLKLVDGVLVASRDIAQYAGKSFQAWVQVSNGESILENLIQISIAPTIKIAEGTGGSFDANQLFSVELPLQLSDSYSIVVELQNDDPSMLNHIETIASQIGDAASIKALDAAPLYVTLGPETDSGTAKFWLQTADSSTPIPLRVEQAADRSFSLFRDDNQRIATFKPVAGNAGASIQLDSYEIQDEHWSQFGFLFDPTSPNLWQFSVRSDAAKERSIGLFMTDAVTGAIVNPNTGALADLDSTTAPQLLDAWSVFSQAIPSSGQLSFTPSTPRAANIDYDNIIWSPYVKELNNGSPSYFFGASYLNADGLAHGLKLSRNSIGFEGAGLASTPDFNDVILAINIST